jgi:hypothetical protein
VKVEELEVVDVGLRWYCLTQDRNGGGGCKTTLVLPDTG